MKTNPVALLWADEKPSDARPSASIPTGKRNPKKPRAVVGLTDLSARVYVKKMLGDNLMSFAVPYTLFLEMEVNVKGSFLERRVSKSLIAES